jgi:hypothetical protein
MITNRPIPEAIDGLPWTVTITPPTNHGGGTLYGVTDLREQRMTLPPEEHPSARYVRLHELAHAKWTPRNVPPHRAAKLAKATVTDVQAAEDLRIQSLLALHRLMPPDLRHRSEDDLRQFAEAIASHIRRNDAFSALEVMTWARVSSGIAAHQTGYRPKHRLGWLPNIHAELERIEDTVAEMLDDGPQTERWATVRGLAQHIATTATIEALPKRRTNAMPFRRITIPLARRMRELLEASRPTLEMPQPCLLPPDRFSPNARWGDLQQLPALPLTEAHRPKAQPTRRKLAQLSGNRIGSLRRLLTDGRAFRRDVRKPTKGGTILIDASGSMHLAAAEIRAILDASPAATVAMYSGNGSTGTITTIAKAGKMATDQAIADRREEVGQGNIIDGPALEWLGKQAEPRTWICDGVVTGCGDSRSLPLNLEANRLTRSGRITRHASVSNYLATLNQNALESK